MSDVPYAKYNYGQEVRVIRNIRNDSTFYGRNRGDLLVRRGSTGFVKTIGRFLLDQVIYQVHFLDNDLTVGCRETELAALDEPWSERKYERGDKVKALATLNYQGETVVAPGDIGSVIGLVDDELPHRYRVTFGQHTWQIPESALQMEKPVELVTAS